MWMCEFFRPKATDASLAPLENILYSLGKKLKEEKPKKFGDKSDVGKGEFNPCADYLDSEINRKKSPKSNQKLPIIIVHSEQSYPIITLDVSINWGELPEKLDELYHHLYDNKNKYYSGDMVKIAEKSHTMVVKIEAYLKETKKAEKKIKLSEATIAINNFHNAFKLSQTKNRILAGLVLAVMGALLIVFAGHVGIPLVVAGFKIKGIGAAISGSGGAGILIEGLRNLFFGSRANLKDLADKSHAAAENLLSPKGSTRNNTTDQAVFSKDNKKNTENTQKNPKKESYVEDENENSPARLEWLIKLFSTSRADYNFWLRVQTDHARECAGGESSSSFDGSNFNLSPPSSP